MAGLRPDSPKPTAITLHQSSQRLELQFDDGASFAIPFELLRVCSPSAEVQGHSPEQAVLQTGKRGVGIDDIEVVGHYALRPRFTDGHESGLFSWDYLYELGRDQSRRWAEYEQKLAGCRRKQGSLMSQTHFGFKQVEEGQKAHLVKGVFDGVAKNYDVMNDLMSGGLHRLWKAYTVRVADLRGGERVLDIAAGTGDLTRAFAKAVGPRGLVLHTDINEAMLREGRNRLLDEGVLTPSLLTDAEALPFPDRHFDLVSVAFGLRNMTHKDKALAEMCRVLKPGGRLLVLEFSQVIEPLRKPYDWYSFNILPKLGQLVAGDADSYRYLAESIRMHPDAPALKAMMKTAGFGHVDVHRLTGGVVALHVGIRC